MLADHLAAIACCQASQELIAVRTSAVHSACACLEVVIPGPSGVISGRGTTRPLLQLLLFFSSHLIVPSTGRADILAGSPLHGHWFLLSSVWTQQDELPPVLSGFPLCHALVIGGRGGLQVYSLMVMPNCHFKYSG